MSIVLMKKVTILSRLEDKRLLLKTIRDAGVVHIKNKKSESGADFQKIKSEYDHVNSAIKVLENYVDKKDKKKGNEAHKKIGNEAIFAVADKVHCYSRELDSIAHKEDQINKHISENKLWDEISEHTVKSLEAYPHLKLRLIKADKSQLKTDEFKDISYLPLEGSKNNLVLVVGDKLPKNTKTYTHLGVEIDKEKEYLEKLHKDRENATYELKKFAKYLDEMKEVQNSLLKPLEFEGYAHGMHTHSSISYIVGFVPENAVDTLKEALSKTKAFAYMIEDAKGEDVPTLLKTNKYTSMLSPVMGILGTFPGYEERDISLWFLSFFSLFFAIIIGDAAYGLIITVIGLVLLFKSKKLNPTNSLVLFLGILTLIWGALTGTWFGSAEILNLFPFLQNLVIPSLATYSEEFFGVDSIVSQNSMMRLSFSLGAIQLCLACVLNVLSKIKTKDLSAIADIGWFSSILSLYFLALMLVIGQKVNTTLVICGVAIGFVLVLLFSGHEPGMKFSKGLKKSLSGAFSAFLDTISAFGNVMSYIRLFAVGIASVAISESFNGLASPLLEGGPLVIFGILILVIGHVLNLVLGLLSVIVHGVRLNVMEFSSQLGIEWTGYEYRPFKL